MSDHRKRVTSTEDATADRPKLPVTASLSTRDRSILDFERDWKRHTEAKEDAVKSEFGLTFARYYQVLNNVIDSPAALSYDPMLVKRLQRIRESRTRARTLMPHTSDDTPNPH